MNNFIPMKDRIAKKPRFDRTRIAQRAKIQRFEDSIGDRTRLSNLQEKIRYLINLAIPEDFEDPKIQKARAQFNRRFDDVVDLKDKLTKAQKTRNNLFDNYLKYNRALFALASQEIGILTSIEAGYRDAVEAEKDVAKNKVEQIRELEREHKADFDLSLGNMSTEEKAKFTKAKKAAKWKMIEKIKELDSKGHRLGPLADIRSELSKIKLSIRALSGWVDTYFNVGKASENLSALETVDLVEKMAVEKSRQQAEKV